MGKKLAALGEAIKAGMKAILNSNKNNAREEIRIQVCFMRSFPGMSFFDTDTRTLHSHLPTTRGGRH
jgi:hypothetical protein